MLPDVFASLWDRELLSFCIVTYLEMLVSHMALEEGAGLRLCPHPHTGSVPLQACLLTIPKDLGSSAQISLP